MNIQEKQINRDNLINALTQLENGVGGEILSSEWQLLVW